MSSKIICFSKYSDARGKLIFFELANHDLSMFKNLSWTIFNHVNKVNVESSRKSTGEIFIALQGNFEVMLFTELNEKKHFTLSSNHYALSVANGTYLSMLNVSQDAIILNITADKKSDAVTVVKESLPLKSQNAKHNCIDDCMTILFFLPTIENNHQVNTQLPFKVERIFYLFDVPAQAVRGGHAHKKCHQILVAVQGSFEVILDDGKNKSKILLNQSNVGLHIPPGIWASEINFALGSICLVMASEVFDESDYIRDYNVFLNSKK